MISLDNSMATEEDRTIQIKGYRDGLLIKLGEGLWPVLLTQLLSNIDARGHFFEGARVALDVGKQALSASEISSLRDELGDRGITLWALIGGSTFTTQNAQNLGLETSLPAHKDVPKTQPFDTLLNGESAAFIQRTMRSGFRVAYGGHVVVLGDVNPGAEIMAGGNVIVWGRLRGVVHAGADGDENAVVCALDLAPTQLRIASLVSIAPKRKGKSHPEVARIQDGQITAASWDVKEGGK
jgi:septum site-determining protein MinC